MKFLVDAQLPPALAEWLRTQGHEAFAVREVGLRDADDRAIWDHAAAYGEVIVTKDEDFVLSASTETMAPRNLWVRVGNVVNRVLLARFDKVWLEIEAHLAAGARIVEIR